jgi:hypothetical protein
VERRAAEHRRSWWRTRAVPWHFDRYLLTTGYNEVINQRQFGLPDLRWPTSYRYPDRTYRDELRRLPPPVPDSFRTFTR